MNDEHPHPEPDESRSSPAQPEDDIAALEREARARREAALLTMQEDEENDPVQPAINKLKKRRRGKATAFLALAAVALIGLACLLNSVGAKYKSAKSSVICRFISSGYGEYLFQVLRPASTCPNVVC